MGDLAERLVAAKEHVAYLERAIGFATCTEIGAHDWQSLGGCNAGCSKDCDCSVPVNECSRCHDCDYGDNDDAREVRRLCALQNGNPTTPSPQKDE